MVQVLKLRGCLQSCLLNSLSLRITEAPESESRVEPVLDRVSHSMLLGTLVLQKTLTNVPRKDRLL